MSAVPSVPTTQKACMVTGQGHPSNVLKQRSDTPVERPRKGEILVKIHASALNPLGWKLMKVVPSVPFLSPRPHIAEYDFSGIVVDSNGTQFKEGDAVYGVLQAFQHRKQGALCQYVAVPTTNVALKPLAIAFEEAAGLGLIGTTAYEALILIGKLEPGQSVFVNGGSTSVGSLAIQVAKAKGCKVIASTSAKNLDTVKGLGADEVTDYTISPPHLWFTKHPPSSKFDVIFDAVGSETDLYLNSEPYLAASGTFLSIGVKLPTLADFPSIMRTYPKIHCVPRWAGGVKARHVTYNFGSGKVASVLEELNKLVDEGVVKPLVDSTYPFEDALKAYDRIMSGRAVGKVVVKAPSD